jgi:3D (Asp-Asp-Asp) domain-containing protein
MTPKPPLWFLLTPVFLTIAIAGSLWHSATNPNARPVGPPVHTAGATASVPAPTASPSCGLTDTCPPPEVLPLRPPVERAARPVGGDTLRPVVGSLAWIHGALYRVKLVHRMLATAYGQGEPGVGRYTFSGAVVHLGSIAVDRSVIPLGTILYVQGYKTPYLPKGGLLGVADDIGSAVRGYHVDLYMPPPATRHDFAEFAAQEVTVYELQMVTPQPTAAPSLTSQPGRGRRDGAGAT